MSLALAKTEEADLEGYGTRERHQAHLPHASRYISGSGNASILPL